MRRREFIGLIGGAAVWPVGARGQQHGRVFRIGLLTLLDSQLFKPFAAAFLDGLHRLGFVESQNVAVEYRYADGDVERLQVLAQELISFNPDVVLATEPSPARTVKRLAPTLPIVCVTLSDQLVRELAISYSRPGGSVTGIASSVEGLIGKLVELVVEIVPGAVRLGFLSNPTGASMPSFARTVEASARGRDITMLTEPAVTRDDLASAFDRLAKQGVQAVIVPPNGLFRVNRREIAQLALAAKLPALSDDRVHVEAGELASYGVDVSENFRIAAGYVAKILKGARPGDLPIEFPTKIELVINLKTAKALGLTIPAALLAHADEVIE